MRCRHQGRNHVLAFTQLDPNSRTSFMNLQKDLPILLPRAIAWAQEQSDLILRHGVPLDEQGLALAKHVGVAKPELVRIQYVAEVPAPEDPMLRAVTDAAEFIGPHTTGMTFGYGIFIVESHSGETLRKKAGVGLGGAPLMEMSVLILMRPSSGHPEMATESTPGTARSASAVCAQTMGSWPLPATL